MFSAHKEQQSCEYGPQSGPRPNRRPERLALDRILHLPCSYDYAEEVSYGFVPPGELAVGPMYAYLPLPAPRVLMETIENDLPNVQKLSSLRRLPTLPEF